MDNIESTIYQILDTIKPDQNVKINPSDDLFSRGVLDSFGMLTYIEAIERDFGLQISTEELIPQNFWSVDATKETIMRLKNG